MEPTNEPTIYEVQDPDPPPPTEPDEAATAELKRKPGRPPSGKTPDEKRAEKREKDRARRAKVAPPTAPEVSAAAQDKTPAQQVALTMADLTEEQRKARTMVLGFLAHGWSEGTRRFLGVALAVPENGQARKDFDELAARRPDVAAAAGAFDAWLTAFDAVAVKRGWYREVPAEYALIVSSVVLAASVAGVYLVNRAQAKADDAERRARAAQEDAARRATEQAAAVAREAAADPLTGGEAGGTLAE